MRTFEYICFEVAASSTVYNLCVVLPKRKKSECSAYNREVSNLSLIVCVRV